MPSSRSVLAAAALLAAAVAPGAALAAPGAASEPASAPDVIFGAFGRHDVRAGDEATVRFQIRNLGTRPLEGVILAVTLSDQLQLASLDCGPLGSPVADGDGCAYPSIPARTLVKATATVRACCPFGGENDVAVAQGGIAGTRVGAGVWMRIAES